MNTIHSIGQIRRLLDSNNKAYQVHEQVRSAVSVGWDMNRLGRLIAQMNERMSDSQIVAEGSLNAQISGQMSPKVRFRMGDIFHLEIRVTTGDVTGRYLESIVIGNGQGKLRTMLDANRIRVMKAHDLRKASGQFMASAIHATSDAMNIGEITRRIERGIRIYNLHHGQEFSLVAHPGEGPLHLSPSMTVYDGMIFDLDLTISNRNVRVSQRFRGGERVDRGRCWRQSLKVARTNSGIYLLNDFRIGSQSDIANRRMVNVEVLSLP